MTTPLLEVRDLVVEFSQRRGRVRTRALDEVCLDIAAGEVLGVVGESGAGKSLTGAAITGLLEPSARIVSGEVRLGGQRIDDLTPSRMRALRGREIATIFQDPMAALDPLCTVGAQLVETLRTHLPLDAAAAARRAIELLVEVGVPAPELRMSQHAHELSGGLRQRVVIALAIAAGPRVLVADEPTTALDVSQQAQVIELLRRLCEARGTAVLLITHDLGVVAEACDRVAVMYAGRVVEVGPARDVLGHPAHPYTAGLMASVPDLEDTRARLAQIDGVMPRPGAVPSGCAFHPRCARASERCRDERPERALVTRTQAACWWPLVEGAPR